MISYISFNLKGKSEWSSFKVWGAIGHLYLPTHYPQGHMLVLQITLWKIAQLNIRITVAHKNSDRLHFIMKISNLPQKVLVFTSYIQLNAKTCVSHNQYMCDFIRSHIQYMHFKLVRT